MLTEEELVREAAAAGFQRDPLKKVICLIDMLESLRSHPFLEPRIAWKGALHSTSSPLIPRVCLSISIDDVRADPREVDQQLVPMLRGDISPVRENLVHWTEELIAECKTLLSVVLPFELEERGFLDRLNDHGEIAPELLTEDAGLQAIIWSHPGLLWKALNVSEHHGLDRKEK